MRAVVASRNPHKLEQLAILLPGIELVPIDALAPGIELDEPFHTFEENALAKARAATAVTGVVAIADDSGIEVDALDGAPGVRSARFAGEHADDEDNNRKLIELLRAVPEDRRTCRYRCVAVAVFPDGREIVEQGSVEGRVVLEARGDGGFGYDPHVVPAGESRTMAEIPLVEKLGFSHRGIAFGALRARLAALTTGRNAQNEPNHP